MINITIDDKSMNLNSKENLILKFKYASANDGEGGETTCSRIKEFCSCYNDNTWTGMSITSCETYILVPPLVCDNCITTSCPSGSSCR